MRHAENVDNQKGEEGFFVCKCTNIHKTAVNHSGFLNLHPPSVRFRTFNTNAST